MAQKDAAGVLLYGNAFREELKAFEEQYGKVLFHCSHFYGDNADGVLCEQEALGRQYLQEMQQLLHKLNNESGGIVQAHKLREAITKIRGMGDIMKLNMVPPLVKSLAQEFFR